VSEVDSEISPRSRNAGTQNEDVVLDPVEVGDADSVGVVSAGMVKVCRLEAVSYFATIPAITAAGARAFLALFSPTFNFFFVVFVVRRQELSSLEVLEI
jgi:hypothetical protein